MSPMLRQTETKRWVENVEEIEAVNAKDGELNAKCVKCEGCKIQGMEFD
jgi:hypothetical protein